MNPETKAKVQQAVIRLVHMWETGGMPEAIARTMIQRQAGDVPSSRWSLCNRLIMLANGTQDARGIRQWNEVGRRVKKGAKAFYILAPCTKKIVTTETDPETGEERQVERVVLLGFTAVPVFRVEDTEGAPLPQPDYRPPVLPPLYEVAERLGVQVEWKPGNGDAYGAYLIAANKIELYTHDVKTFFHELAHAAHSKIEPLKGGQDPRQEIIAETVAQVLCILYGIKGYERHGLEYIRSYIGRNGGDPVRVVLSLLADIERVLELILNLAHQDGGQEAAAA